MTQAQIGCLQRAAAFYRDQLMASPRAIAYLKGRGLRGDIAARYGLGFAPANSQGLRRAFPSYAAPVLVDSGLVIVNDAGRRYDRFRDRIMVPILDDAGAVVGFGGRLLEGDGPKYLNSPETALFQKGRILFGLPQAATAIAETGAVYVVEGYLDVVSLAQHGVQNAVATLGTATTGQHVRRLLSLAKRVVFCFDGDIAGRSAAARALEGCLPHVSDSTDITFLFLPREHDPDSFVRAHGAEVFLDLVHEAVSLEGFFLASAMDDVSLEWPEGRARLVAMAAPGLQQLHAPALVRRLLETIALHTHFTMPELVGLCGLRKAANAIDGQ
ncbi:DNA primase (plasmid) [Ralstonia pseudosolanacearum]